MNFEHLVFFHGFTKQRSPETQRPCARLRDGDRHVRSASGDPAMVSIFRMASILSVVRAPCPAQRPDCCWTFIEHDLVHALAHDRPRKFGVRFSAGRPYENARNKRAYSWESTTNVVLFKQGLVTRLILPLNVIEQGTACCDHFQKTPARMIVFHVGLEMPGEVLDDFRFAFGGNRHRQTFSLLRPELAVSPVRLNTRLGMSSPLPISARARSR